MLTKTECLYIATKFNDEARARLVLRWQELELREQERRQQLALPSPKKMSSYNFNAVLRDMGIQYRRHGRWNICEELEGRGLTVKNCEICGICGKKSGICGKQLVKVVKVIWSKSIYDHEVILTNTNCTNLTNLRLIALLSLKATTKKSQTLTK